jgi:isopentenyl-diphosphate delta-isomerase
MTSSLAAERSEHVVLVDDDDQPIGTADKATIHHSGTPLHRGFSVFLFDRQGRLLLQQRSLAKRTWPGVWSNSCCGHPRLRESTTDAMRRRIDEELGIRDVELTVVLPDYRYRAELDGVVENELCPVAVGCIDQMPVPNQDEVAAISWLPWPNALDAFARGAQFSPWCVEEAQLLDRHLVFQSFYRDLTSGRETDMGL